jgi:hypothetical protein
MDLSPLDRSMVRLYMAGCFHDWDQLPGAEPALSNFIAAVAVPARLLAAPAALQPLLRLTPASLHGAELARDFYARGASIEQMRGCVRHMVVFAGYGPCLAATLALHKAKLLPEDTPAKVTACVPMLSRLRRVLVVRSGGAGAVARDVDQAAAPP